jgi:phosphoribosyl 1,2-cyclic phosphate phosphodiesterase
VIRNRKRIPCWMDASTAAVVASRFDYCFTSKAGYPAILEQREMVAGQIVRVEGLGGVMEILPLAQDHGFTSSLGFRIGNFAYCNDVVRLPDETLARLGGLDILVLDALRYTDHPTHASVRQALAWVEQLKPRRALLTNLHVDLDYATLKAELPAGVEPAFDGMELRLGEG